MTRPRPLAMVTAALLALSGAPPGASYGTAQESAEAEPPALEPGPHGVGFRVIEAYDSTRAFRPKRDHLGRRAAGETARPVQVGLWYPASVNDEAPRMTAGEFRLLRESELTFEAPAPSEAAEVRGAFVDAVVGFGADSVAAAALWDEPTPAVRDAPPVPGPHPAVLYFTSAGVSDPLLPAHLASHGFAVATFPSNGRMTEVALEFTPNALSLDTDVDDAGFVYGRLRHMPLVDAERLAIYAFSGGSLAAVLWQMRDMQADAIVTVEGWERFRRGADILSESAHHDPARIRVPFLMIERAAAETSPAYAKVPDVVDGLRYADLLRVAFRDAAHGDFLSHVTRGHTADQARIYETSARTTRLFLQARLLGDPAAADSLAALRPPEDDPFFTRTRRTALPPVPTEEELFRMAELDPDAAARAYRAARASAPDRAAGAGQAAGRERGDRPPVLFRERVLTRAATFAGSAADRATIMEIVTDAYPRSVAARWRLAEAYGESGRPAAAEATLREALERVDTDPALAPGDRDEWRRRIREALGTDGHRTGGGPEGGEPAPRFTRVVSGPAVTDAYSSPSASWMDVDGDGDEDLFVLNGFGSLEDEPRPQPDRLYLNDGAGRLEPVREHPLVDDPTFSGASTWGDYDEDGDDDLFVANQRGADNVLYRNDGGGAFARVDAGPVTGDGGRSFSAVWVDVDADGLLDLHVLNGRDGGEGEVDFLYRNLGDGAFERLVDLPFVREALRSGGGAWADFDGDGDPDLLLPVYEAGEPVRLYRNDGGWRFTEVASEVGLAPDPLPFAPAASVAQWIDYDGDGDLDIFVGTTRGVVDFLFANDGRGGFRRVEAGRVGLDATYVSDAVWLDLDNDADLDLVLAVWGSASEIWLNDGQGRLRPAETGDFGATVTFASSVSASDVDGDGDLDLYLTQWPINEAGGAPNHLYRNDGPAGNWLRIDLRGTESNRSAVGALVTVTAEIEGERRRQTRAVTARSSWRAANGPTVHVGLGDAERAERIEVAWPSGRTDTLADPVPANRRIEIVEGEDAR